MALTLKQFIDKWNGKKADWDNAYGGQCVDLFRFYNKEVLEIPQPKSVVGAADFWANYDTDPVLKDNFTKIKNTADFKPIKGDVMLWNKRAGGGFGHVAMVSDDKADLNTFNSFDQNWSRVSYCEIVNHDYKNVYGVLRPKKQLEEDIPVKEEKFYTEEEMTTVRLERDANWDLYQKEKSAHEETKAELDKQKTITQETKKELTAFLETLASKLSVVVDKNEVIGAVERLLTKEDQLNEVNKKLEQQEKKHILEKDELKVQIQDLRSEIERQQKQNETLLLRVDDLSTKMEELESQEPVVSMNRITKVLNSLFERLK